MKERPSLLSAVTAACPGAGGVAESREGTGARGGAEVVAWLSERVGLGAGA